MLTEKLEQRLTAQGQTEDAGAMLAAFGYQGEALEQVLDNVMEKAQQAGETLLSAVVSTAIKSAAYAVVYVVSFLLLLILLRLALTPLHLFTKLPVVHGVNAVLGGALGLVKGRAAAVFGGVGAAKVAAVHHAGDGGEVVPAEIFRRQQPHGSDRKAMRMAILHT